MDKVIEIPVKEFTKMVSRLDYYKDRVKDLEKVIEFLNEQIDDYNRNFTKVENKDAK